tara:strand:+ start:216 stop:497 length:282 start_codon:yes stop_codon:yes gene_type:complete
MVSEIRRTEIALGEVDYNISLSSRKNINNKRSTYISSKINKDEMPSKNNIKVIRPNFGLYPKFYKEILTKKVNKTLDKGTRLKRKYIKKNKKI